MGIDIEQWRVAIGRWSGGRSHNINLVGNTVTRKQHDDSSRWFSLVLLASLLIIGCVEINPGPNSERTASSSSSDRDVLPKYKKRQGSVNYGVMYEVRMATFLFLRGMNRTEDFLLASNVDGVDAFDDLVFKYKYKINDNKTDRTCFIQLKHKINQYKVQRSSLKQLSGDFSLFKYYKSYCKIKENFSTHQNLKHCCPFGNSEFILYTNAAVKSESRVKGDDSDPVSILSSGEVYGKYLQFNEEKDQDIFLFFEELSRCSKFLLQQQELFESDDKLVSEIETFQNSLKTKEIFDKLNELKSKPKQMLENLIAEVDKCDFSSYIEFLHTLKIFSCQANKNQLESIIKTELSKVCQISPKGAKVMYEVFKEYMINWWEKRGSTQWINKNSFAWKQTKEFLIHKINSMSENVKTYKITFALQHIQILADLMKNSTFVNIITNSTFNTIAVLKICQALEIMGLQNYLFINLSSLLIRKEEVFTFWPSKWNYTLIINCESESENMDELANNFSDILQFSAPKIILITQNENHMLIRKIKQNHETHYTEYEDTCTYLDLDSHSQKEILNFTVNFQGKEVSLVSLVDHNPSEKIKQNIDLNVMSQLLTDKHKLCIGEKLADLIDYYIPRILKHNVYLSIDKLKTWNNTCVFAVSGAKESDLKELIPPGEKVVSIHNEKALELLVENPEGKRFIFIGEENLEYKFNKLRSVYGNYLHWLHMNDGSLIWRESSGNINAIYGYIDQTKYKEYNIESIMEYNNRTMILAAEPGMGKSTFLTHLGHAIKESDPSVWVLRINLNEHTHTLNRIQSEKSSTDECKCKQFLWSTVHSPKSDTLKLTEVLFQEMLEKKKVVVVLDGFDEVSPCYSEEVQILIKEVRENMNLKIWISTRFSFQFNLEWLLSKISFIFQPFTKNDQINFLKQYWNKIIKDLKPINSELFANKLLNLCSENFSDKDSQFTGIPLQTMMLGEAFTTDVVHYNTTREINLPQKLNLLALFKQFINKKCEIHFIEKNKRDRTKPGTIKDMKKIVDKHLITALYALFPAEELSIYLGSEEPYYRKKARKFQESGEAESFGIITGFINDKARFIHRCFAEYFCAEWFKRNFTKYETFIRDKLFTSACGVIRIIFDRMLAEGFKLHEAVLNNNMPLLKRLLKEDTNNVNCLDTGGRTPLHLAASYNSELIRTLLSVQGVNINKTDTVLKWTPLRYADQMRSWMAMDILLQYKADPSDIVLTVHYIESEDWGQVALYEAAEKGYVRLLEVLLNSGIDLNACVRVRKNSFLKNTLIHIGSLSNQIEIVKLLLQKCDIVDIGNALGQSALHLAVLSNSMDTFELLLDRGASPNLADVNGFTPLHMSAALGRHNATRILAEKCDDMDTSNNIGQTPLVFGAFHGHLDVVRILIENYADVNIICTRQKYTPLHYAVEGQKLNIVRFLLEKKCNINSDTNIKNDISPLHLAVKYQNFEIVEYLIKKGADVNIAMPNGLFPIHSAVYLGNINILQLLVKSGSDINRHDRIGNRVLHLAALKNNTEIMKYIIQLGADLNACDNYGFTPLCLAAFHNNTESVLYLLEKGANANLPNNDLYSPLYFAVRNNNLDCVKRLIDFDANINFQGKCKVTALSKAVEMNRKDIARYLLDHGADINLQDERGKTAVHVAHDKGHSDLISYLIAKSHAE